MQTFPVMINMCREDYIGGKILSFSYVPDLRWVSDGKVKRHEEVFSHQL